MDKKDIDTEKLAHQLLNEIKYNKRYMYNWLEWSQGLSESSESNLTLLELLSKKIKKIYSSIGSTNCSDTLVFESEPVPIFKKIKDESEGSPTNVISFGNHEVEEEDIEFNYFFKCDINTLALSVIWNNTVGKAIDSQFEDDVYANRLSNRHSIYKPYFRSYSNFRDNSFKAMKGLIENNKTGVYIQTDLKNCFYNIKINKLEEKVNKKISDNKKYLSINKKVFKVIKEYNKLLEEKTDKYKDKPGVLPIGFLPSNTLINLYLKDLDKLIKNELHPIEYGRYVDDIGLLISTDVELNNKNETVKKLKEKLDILFNNKELGVEQNKNKTLYFIITKDSDENYLKKFEKSVRELSSDSYRLLDTAEFEEELIESYIIHESPTRLKEMCNIKRDKKSLSRIISSIFNSIFNTFNSDKIDEQLVKHFIETFYKLMDDRLFLELFDYWYQLVVIELFYMGDLETFENYKETKTYTKIMNLLKNYKEPETISFLNLYKNLLDSCESKNLILKSFETYFRLPNFKIKGLKNYFLKYENQLHNIFNWYNEKDNEIDELFEKYISDEGRFRSNEYLPEDSITIGQASIHSYRKRFEYFLKRSENLSAQPDFIKVFNDGLKYNADILVFPEQGLTFNDLPFIAKQSVKYRVAIVGGFDFILKSKYAINLSVAIVPEQTVFENSNGTENVYNDARIHLALKKYPAPSEYEIFHNSVEYEREHRKREVYLPNINKFEGIYFDYLGKKHAVLNCYEATDLETKYELSKKEPLITHLITNNKDVNYFEKIAINLSREIMGAITMTNYAEYGGTLVYVPFSERYRRIVSAHKGASNTHVDISKVNLKNIGYKRRNNLDKKYKQNPPNYYYKNLGFKWDDK